MTPVESRNLKIPFSLNLWIRDNSPQIVSGIEDAYRRRVMEAIVTEEGTGAAFDRSSRSPSEMPICDHAWSELPLPPGCRLVPWDKGKVHIYQETGEVITYNHHTYARDSDNRVICVTPGLFEALFENLLPGYRLSRLKQKAPLLITLLPDKTGRFGIAVLYGSDQEIFQQLSFVYTAHTGF